MRLRGGRRPCVALRDAVYLCHRLPGAIGYHREAHAVRGSPMHAACCGSPMHAVRGSPDPAHAVRGSPDPAHAVRGSPDPAQTATAGPCCARVSHACCARVSRPRTNATCCARVSRPRTNCATAGLAAYHRRENSASPAKRRGRETCAERGIMPCAEHLPQRPCPTNSSRLNTPSEFLSNFGKRRRPSSASGKR